MPNRRRFSSAANLGFTLIEILIVVAIAAVLTAIAVPSYGDYLRRARIVEAAAKLADHRARMEQFFLDHRRYDDGAGNCGQPLSPASAADTFSMACFASPGAYVVSATGVPGTGMAGFAYAIDEANVRRTTAVPDGWVANAQCWVIRRDGTCL
jgi:type IV pilus assembly protein PilE